MKKALLILLLGLAIILLVSAKANPGITHDFVTIDSCDNAGTWTPTGQGAVSNNTVDYKQGTGAINVYKSGTLAVDFGASKTIVPTNFRGKVLVIWLYFNSKATLDLLKVAQVRIYDSAGNYAYFNIPMQVGWQAFRRIGDKPDGTSATAPDYSAIVKIAVYFETSSASDTTVEGSFVMDFWHLGYYVQTDGGTFDAPIPFSDIVDWDRNNAMGLLDYVGGTYVAYWRQLIVNTGALSITNTKLIFYWSTDRALWVKSGAGLRVLDSYIELSAEIFYGSSLFMEYNSRLESKRSTWVSRIGSIGLNLLQEEDVTDTTIIGVFITVGNYFGITTYRVSMVGSLEASIVRCKLVQPEIKTDRLTLWESGTIIGGIFGKSLVFNKLREYTGYLIDVLGLPKDLTSILMGAGTNTHLYVQYSFNLRLVDQLGNPVANATVRLFDKNGNQVFSVNTDSDGNIPEQIVTVQDYLWDGSKFTLTDYNPFRLYIELNGVKQVEFRLLLYNPYRATITMSTIYNVEARVKKPYYSLNEEVIIEFVVYDWNKRPVTGLTVNATITKPDGTQVTISLKDDGVAPDEVANDGVYTGQFTNTSQVGTYFVDVTTQIYSNTVTARASFSVGNLESLIVNVNHTLSLLILSVNNTVKTVNGTLSSQITSVNSTVKSSNSTIVDSLKGIANTISQIKVDFTPVLNKIDQSTSTILDTLSKISSQLNNYMSQPAEITIPSWVIWLLVTQVLLLFFIYLAIKRQSEILTIPQLQPSSGSRVAKIVLAVIILAIVYILLTRLSTYIPIPLPIVTGVIVILIALTLKLGVKKTLALIIVLGLIGYLVWSRLNFTMTSMNIPLPVISLTVVFIIFTIIFILLRRRKKQQVMV